MDFSLLQKVADNRKTAPKKSVSSSQDATALLDRLYTQVDSHYRAFDDSMMSGFFDSMDEMVSLDFFENPFPETKFCELAKFLTKDDR